MKTTNRVVTLLLVLCLMLSLAIPAVLASNDATTPYSFDYLTNASLPVANGTSYAKWPFNDAEGQINNKDALNAAYANGTINSTILYHNFSNISNANNGKTYSVSLQAGGISSPAMAGDYLAIKIKSPGAGNYQMTCEYTKNDNNAYVCDIYILPANTAESAISDKSALTSSAKVASVGMASDPSDKTFDFTLGNAEEYMVVFYAAENASKGKAYLRPTKMNFVKVGSSTPAESTPAESTPAESTPVENIPSTGDSSSIVVMAALMIASVSAIALVLLTDNRRKHA